MVPSIHWPDPAARRVASTYKVDVASEDSSSADHDEFLWVVCQRRGVGVFLCVIAFFLVVCLSSGCYHPLDPRSIDPVHRPKDVHATRPRSPLLAQAALWMETFSLGCCGCRDEQRYPTPKASMESAQKSRLHSHRHLLMPSTKRQHTMSRRKGRKTWW